MLGQAGTVTSNILLQNIDSHHNRFDGLNFDPVTSVFLLSEFDRVEESNARYKLADIIVFDSKFNENGDNGVEVNTLQLGNVENLVLSGVQANKNGDSGFVLDFISTGRLVDVEAKNNGSDVDEIERTGITIGRFGATNSNLVIQDSTVCGNGDTSNGLDIRDEFNGASFKAISCANDDGKGICACDC